MLIFHVNIIQINIIQYNSVSFETYLSFHFIIPIHLSNSYTGCILFHIVLICILYFICFQHLGNFHIFKVSFASARWFETSSSGQKWVSKSIDTPASFATSPHSLAVRWGTLSLFLSLTKVLHQALPNRLPGKIQLCFGPRRYPGENKSFTSVIYRHSKALYRMLHDGKGNLQIAKFQHRIFRNRVKLYTSGYWACYTPRQALKEHIL